MIRVALYDHESEKTRFGTEELIQIWSESSDQMIWVDIESHDKAAERTILEGNFKINRLAIDDAQRDRHPPKIEWFDEYFFLLVKAFNAQTDSIQFGILHISFFISDNFIVTRHDGISPSINKTWALLESQEMNLNLGSNKICYRVVRTIVDRYTPVILKLETRLEELEDMMLHNPSDNILSELIIYNSRLKKLRRIFSYQENVFYELSRNTSHTTITETQHEYQDIHEQMERLSSLCDLFQGLSRDLIDSYISVTSHRLNQIMKVLTIVAVIFLPLTFLAGVYGMNFEHMPELQWEKAYYIILGIMAGLAIAMILLFRKLKWL
jgi:magnesium transporter